MSLNEPISSKRAPSRELNFKVPEILLFGLSGNHHMPLYSNFFIVIYIFLGLALPIEL
jgi:hypothetical protein